MTGHLARLFVALFATASMLLVLDHPAGAQTSIDWPAYLNGAQHSSYNGTATAITPGNATTLGEAWNFTPPNGPVSSLKNSFLSSPTVYQGVIYVGNTNGTFYALDEVTGAVKWSNPIGQLPKIECPAFGSVATATVAPDLARAGNPPAVYYAAPDGYLYAWDAVTGAQLWRTAVAVPSTTVNDYAQWASPTVANGKIYVGISSNCDNPLVQGGLREYDQATGSQLASFDTNPVGVLGGSIWSSAMVASDGSVFVSTGNPSGSVMGYSESIVRLDGNTLAPLDSFALPPGDKIPDADFGASPVQWTATLGGVPTPMVGACNKNGKFYALRQSNLAAGTVWADQLGVSPMGDSECIAAAVWDSDHSHLYLASNQTTIQGVTYPGSLREVNPATGTPIWQTGLQGAVVGTPTLDGSGVLAVPTYDFKLGQPNAVFLLDASNGNLIATLNTNNGKEFAQPVFADNYVFAATAGQGLFAYTPMPGGVPPTITAVGPSSGPPAGGTSVTITGTNLIAATVLKFGSTNATLFHCSSDTSCTATSPPGTGAVDVTVTTPAGTSATSSADVFSYGTSVSVALSPSSVVADGQSTVTATATVLDSNMNPLPSESVAFATSGAQSIGPVTNHNDGTYTATITASLAVGTDAITATDTSTTPSISGTASLVQTAGSAPPTVTSVAPSSGSFLGGTSVTITGTNFIGVTSVSFGSTQATSFTQLSTTQVVATAPAAPVGVKAVPVRVSVVYKHKTSALSTGDTFTYTYPVPNVLAVNPRSGLTSGGTVVTITGTGFLETESVSFGRGMPAASFTVDSATQITATTPPEPAGRQNVLVKTPGGLNPHSGHLPDWEYTFVAPGSPPTITGVTPNSGPAAGGTSVTVSGTGLFGANVITFGPNQPSYFKCTSDTSCTVTTPPGSGTVDVTATTPNGTSTTSSADQFTYNVSPTVSSVVPASGAQAGGTPVTITGTGLTGGGVNFGTTPATSVSCTATTCTATSPAGTGTVDVTVTTPNGTSTTSAADLFTYIDPAPAVTLSKKSGPVGKAITATLTGYGAFQVVSLTWGSTTGPTLATTTMSSTGSGIAGFVVPTSPDGSYAVVATGAGGSPSVSTPFTVISHLSLSKGSGPVGKAITATLTGFDPSQVVTLTWGSATGPTLATTTTDATGTGFAGFVVPPSPGGRYTVVATGAGGTPQATSHFTLFTKVALSPNRGHVGTSVSATMTGFPASQLTSIYWCLVESGPEQCATQGPAIGTVTTDSLGNGQIAFVVPTLSPAKYGVYFANGADGLPYSVAFTVK